MGRYVISRRITATPQQVYRAFADPTLLADWMHASGVVGATGPLDAAGTRFTLVIKGPWRFQSAVVGAEPPSRHEFAGRGPLGADYRMVATLTPRDYGTDLDLLTEYTVPLGVIGRWIDRRWIDREPRATANREVDRLVELVSGDQVASASRGAIEASAASP